MAASAFVRAMEGGGEYVNHVTSSWSQGATRAGGADLASLSRLTHKQLQKRAKAAGIAANQKKAVLVRALVEHARAQARLDRIPLPIVTAQSANTSVPDLVAGVAGLCVDNKKAVAAGGLPGRLVSFLRGQRDLAASCVEPFRDDPHDGRLLEFALREVTVKEEANIEGVATVVYRTATSPSRANGDGLAELWRRFRCEFHGRCKESEVWPAGDFATIKSYIQTNADDHWRHAALFAADPVVRYGEDDDWLVGNWLAYDAEHGMMAAAARVLWEAFVVPYLQILRVPHDGAPPSVFTFVYVGGGAGAFVRPTSDGAKVS